MFVYDEAMRRVTLHVDVALGDGTGGRYAKYLVPVRNNTERL